MGMTQTKKQIIKFIGVFMMLTFWTEYLTRDVYVGLAAGAVGAALSLRAGTSRFKDEKFERAFVHFTAIHGESGKIYMKKILDNPVQKNGLFLLNETAYVVRFTLDGTSRDQVLKLVKLAAPFCKKLVIYGNNVRLDGMKETTPIPVEVRDAKHLIADLTAANALPDVPEEFQRAVCGERVPGKAMRSGYLLLSAFVMALFSSFSPLKLYMLIWASVLVCMAIYLALKKERPLPQ